MCIISTGFPIGYHIMSAFIFSSIKENGWQLMKRRIAVVELLVTCILGPFFTTKCLPNSSQGYQYPLAPLRICSEIKGEKSSFEWMRMAEIWIDDFF